ncbi:unnamed protein product [Camellia sinensis]
MSLQASQSSRRYDRKKFDLGSSFQRHSSSFRSISGLSSVKDDVDDECALQWAAIERLPTFERLRSSLFDENDGSNVDAQGKRVVDVTKLGALERNMFIDKLIKHIENDNLRLLHKLRKRIDNWCKIVDSEWKQSVRCFMANPFQHYGILSRAFFFNDCAKLPGLKSQEAKITIIDDVSGIIKPGRTTLLLGPPGCGKGTLVKALSGKLSKSLKLRMEEKLIGVAGELAVRALKAEQEISILGLDICAYTLIGDAMRRGISGGQKKRLTTELAHITDATILVALLQPAPETFDLFDDIILTAEGKIVYHGPCSHVLEFFEDCGFRCSKRKGVADFPQEVISKKDQAQYWHQTEQSRNYISADMFSKKFKESPFGKKLDEELSKPFSKPHNHKNTISFSKYSLSKWALIRACMSGELLLMGWNSFIYVFKSAQLVIIASVAMTVFLRTRMNVDAIHANYYLGALFYAIIIIFFFDGFPELSLTIGRLAVFYKQRDLYFYPAWAYAIPATILKVPISLFSAPIWTSLTYYVVGYSPEAGRFFLRFIIFLALHLAATFMFRFVASVFHTAVASTTAASMPTWLKWGFWVSPLTYGELELALNEFLAPRWQKCQVVLPFEPLTLVFQNVQFYVDTTAAVRERGFTQKKLCDITGAFRPGVLTALMGVSGVVKTTLMDVLAGRKTSGTIEGGIRIGGFPKVQVTFARISGICERSP